jgi:hypothetical protein
MALRKQPVFRRTIVPWYDSIPMCIFLAVFCLIVWVYSIIGIGVATVNLQFNTHIWMPRLLLLLSSIALVSLGTRLVKRYLSR